MAGRTLIGGFDVNGQSLAFINFFKLATNQNAGSFAFPGTLDTNGYPNLAAVTTAITGSLFLYSGYGTSNWVLTWTGDGAVKIDPGSKINVVSSSGCTVTGNLNFNMTVTSSGTGATPRVVFNFDTGTPSGALSWSFPTGATYSNMSGLVLCRADQESLLNSGEIFNPDFISLIQLLNPKVVRLMDWCSPNFGIAAQHSHRAPVAALSYRTIRWMPEAWVGTISGSGIYTCPAPSSWPGLVDGAAIQGQVQSANTTLAVSAAANNGSGLVRLTLADTSSLSTGQRVGFSSSGGTGNNGGIWTVTVIDGTHVDLQGSVYTSNITGTISTATLAVGGGLAKPVIGSGGSTTAATNDIRIAVYSSILDAWLWGALVTVAGGAVGASGAVPIEIQVALWNKLNIDGWTCVNALYTTSAAQSHAAYVRDNLSSSLTCYFEYANEVWNFGFTPFNIATLMGRGLGFPPTNSEQGYGYYGLRVRQIMGAITTDYGAQSNYKRVIAFQAFGNTVNTKSYMFNGTDLVTGNANYNAFTGSVSYNAFPNRPIDYCDAISYATYFAGGVLNNGLGSAYHATGTYTGLTAAADSYLSGDTATAFDWVDGDLRSGTSTISGSLNTVQTIGVLNSSIYPAWEGVADDYDSQRTGAGMAVLGVASYEGGCESKAPTTTQCTTIGISTGYSATITAMLVAYKATNEFQQLCRDQIDEQVAAHAARSFVVPGWFALQGASQWSMLGGNTYADKYQSFDAHRLYNNRLRRKQLIAAP